MRAESTGMTGVKQVMIFDGTKQVMTTIDPDKKTYTEMTQADVDKIAEQMSGDDGAAPEADGEPAAGGARADGSGDEGPRRRRRRPKIVYKKTGTDTVGKWKCDKYEGFEGEKKVSEVCTVDPKALGFALTDFDGHQADGRVFQEDDAAGREPDVQHRHASKSRATAACRCAT